MNTEPSPSSAPAPPPASGGALIVLFDGSCGFCNSSVRFILARDPARRFRFAPLGSPVAGDLLREQGLRSDQIDSLVLIDGERAYLRSNAVLRIAMELPDPWPLAAAAAFIPQPLRDAAYDFIARHRKQWFKTPDTCTVPTAEQREQFLA